MIEPALTPRSRAQPSPEARRLIQVGIVAVLAIVAYLGLGLVGGWSSTLDALRSLGPGQWAVLLGLSLLNYCLRFMRWHAYLRALGVRLPLFQDLLIYIAGFAFTVTPGKAGEAVRSVYLRAAGVSWSPGLAALAAERVLDLAAVALLTGLALANFGAYLLPALALVTCVVAGLFVITHPSLADRLLALLPSVGRWAHLKRGAREMLAHTRALLGPRRLSVGLTIGLAAWAAEALGFYLLLDWLGVAADVLTAAGIYAASMLAGAASFLPGGLGGAEAAMVALLVASGVAFATATTATLICRAVTLWFAVGLGIVAALVLWLARNDRHRSRRRFDIPSRPAEQTDLPHAPGPTEPQGQD
jgi:glycosyltransferase 2 family protein